MAAHEHVLPGAADRIMLMAEKEQDHEHRVRDTIVGAEIGLRYVGQALAMLALMLMLALAAYFAYLGHAGIGATFAGVIVVVVCAFLGYRTISSKIASVSKDSAPPKDSKKPSKPSRRR